MADIGRSLTKPGAGELARSRAWAGVRIAAVRAKVVIVGGLFAGCSVENPWFGLATEGETTGSGTVVGSVGETMVPTTQPGPGTDASATSASTGPLTATEPGTTTGSTSEATSTSTGSGETGVPAPDMGGVVCGNGVLDADEACDDGNVDPGDGCEANCEPMFGHQESVAVAAGAYHIAAADLDDDQKTDLVVTHVTGGVLEPDYSLLANKGGGQFEVKATLAVGNFVGATQVLVGQMVGDDKPDLVLVAATSGKPLLFENKSAPGKFQFIPVLMLNGQPFGAVADATLADLNSDGFSDLVLISGEQIFVHINNKVGGFELPWVYGLETKIAVGVSAGPVIKGDNAADVVVVFAGVPDTTRYLNKIAELSLEATMDHCPEGATAVRAGDADAAGPEDLVIGCANGQLTLAGHDGLAAYTRTVMAGLPAIASVGVIDLYGGDEAKDVFGTSPNGKAVLVGVQQGKKVVANYVEMLDDGPTASAVLDFDGDGAPDLAVVFPQSGKVGLLRNQTRD